MGYNLYMTIADITTDPLLASTAISLSNGLELTVRPLLKNDQDMFGAFLSGLSPATNSLYQPHPLTVDAAREICQNLNYANQLPFVAVTNKGEIAAYFLFSFEYSELEAIRYKGYGIAIDFSKDCRFAPVVADAYQGKGLGGSVFKALLPIIRQLPLHSLLLSGGTWERNKRAIAFYEKNGFKLVGEFEENTKRNFDMMLIVA